MLWKADPWISFPKCFLTSILLPSNHKSSWGLLIVLGNLCNAITFLSRGVAVEEPDCSLHSLNMSANWVTRDQVQTKPWRFIFLSLDYTNSIKKITVEETRLKGTLAEYVSLALSDSLLLGMLDNRSWGNVGHTKQRHSIMIKAEKKVYYHLTPKWLLLVEFWQKTYP